MQTNPTRFITPIVFLLCIQIAGCDKSTTAQPAKLPKIIPKVANTVLVTQSGGMTTKGAAHYTQKIEIDFKHEGQKLLNMSGETDAYVCNSTVLEFWKMGKIKKKTFQMELRLVENKGDSDIWRVTEVIGDLPLSVGDEFDYRGGERLICENNGTKIYLTDK